MQHQIEKAALQEQVQYLYQKYSDKKKETKRVQEENGKLQREVKKQEKRRENLSKIYEKILEEGLKLDDARRVIEKFQAKEREREMEKEYQSQPLLTTQLDRVSVMERPFTDQKAQTATVHLSALSVPQASAVQQHAYQALRHPKHSAKEIESFYRKPIKMIPDARSQMSSTTASQMFKKTSRLRSKSNRSRSSRADSKSNTMKSLTRIQSYAYGHQEPYGLASTSVLQSGYSHTGKLKGVRKNSTSSSQRTVLPLVEPRSKSRERRSKKPAFRC